MSLDKYYFLLSSLPLLSLERESAIDSHRFLEDCRRVLSNQRFSQLRQTGLVPSGQPVCGIDAAWQAWETYLRNLLVWRRCHHIGCESAHQWIRPETDVFPSIIRQVDEAVSEDTPLSRERLLDQIRWQALDHLAVGHYFDFESLIIYRIRLLLVEKWRDHDTKHGRAAFLDLVDRLAEQAFSLRRNSVAP